MRDLLLERLSAEVTFQLRTEGQKRGKHTLGKESSHAKALGWVRGPSKRLHVRVMGMAGEQHPGNQ